MRQFVEADQRNLRTQPVINSGFELQVRELDLAAARPAPLAHSHVRGAAELRIEISALIPERSGIGNLGHGAPEKDGGEIGNPADMAQWLEDQAGRLAPHPPHRHRCRCRPGSAETRSGVRAARRLLPQMGMPCLTPRALRPSVQGPPKPIPALRGKASPALSVFPVRRDSRF